MARVRLTEKSLRKPAPATGQLELWDDLVPGFGLRISAGGSRADGSRTYFVMKRLNGKLVRRTVGKVPVGVYPVAAKGELSLADARKTAREMLLALTAGDDPKPRKAVATADDAPKTFSQVAADYFKDPAKRGGARLASRLELERKVRVDLVEWHDRPIAEITKADIKVMLAAKRKAAPVAANRLLALIRRVFGWAAIEDIIAANPAAHIEGTDEEERDRVLTMTELARVWRGAEALGYPYGPLVQSLILTAQRTSEVAGLPWSEIDGSSWRLPDQRSKRRKGHLVPLSPRTLSILASAPRMGSKPTFVFTTGRRQVAKGERLDKAALVGRPGFAGCVT